MAVERATGSVLGCFCESCEQELVDRTTSTTNLSMTTCLVCGDEATVLLPQWDTLVRDDDGVVTFEYTVALDTPGCCTACALGTGPVPVDGGREPTSSG